MNKGQRTLVGLAALFLAPLAVAFVIYYGHGGISGGKRLNHGELLSPVQPLSAHGLTFAAGGDAGSELFRRHWSLLLVAPNPCDARCRQVLYDTRQVRLALDRDMVRVQRVLLISGDCCDLAGLKRDHPDLVVVRAAAHDDALLAQLPGAPGDIYLIDPLSNLVMRYGAGVPAKGLLEDMKRLLKLSQIG
jgi:hypothetical protein